LELQDMVKDFHFKEAVKMKSLPFWTWLGW
jgi:hypothetical protein